MNWAQNYRVEWIADMLMVYGFINRSHICRKFDVSVPQASADLKAYNERYPQTADHDTKTKTYKARP